MLAVDTSVVVRFLIADDPVQHKRAVALFSSHDIWLPKTVLLETEWVLRSAFGFEPAEIEQALRKLIALPRVRCEDLGASSLALDGLAAGLDFGDALHQRSSPGADEGFATFDTRFAKRARKLWPTVKVVVP
ncbi:type II toxin-antitoxin system VapC family toxin [Pseudorhodoferax sp.]|uniref:type II toxin-antitoxin system VapC family toxin n=1 Tax=Pseudorhodoferax sp. TaxID=1993553 RepID=UPI0039E429A0